MRVIRYGHMEMIHKDGMVFKWKVEHRVKRCSSTVEYSVSKIFSIRLNDEGIKLNICLT